MPSADIDAAHHQQMQAFSRQRRDLQPHNGHQLDTTRSSPPDSAGRTASKPYTPTRSNTVGPAHDHDKKYGSSASYDAHPHARSEDLHHSRSDNSNSNMTLGASPSGSPMPGFQTLSRPLTPNDSRSGASSSNHSESGAGFTDDSTTLKRLSATSLSSTPSAAGSKAASNATSVSSAPSAPTTCAACSQPLEGAFVRALGNVWHLQCFKCKVSSLHLISSVDLRLLNRGNHFISRARTVTRL
jgi:hypothetical protein